MQYYLCPSCGADAFSSASPSTVGVCPVCFKPLARPHSATAPPLPVPERFARTRRERRPPARTG
jgi:predicted amidophosphoribosyltransferase